MSFSLYPGLVATTRTGSQFFITSCRGHVNVKGRSVEDGTVTTKMFQIPRTAIVDTRRPNEAESASLASQDAENPRLQLGMVVTFKHPPKNTRAGERYVVFKENGDTFNLVRLGGDPNHRYYRGVSAHAVNVENV